MLRYLQGTSDLGIRYKHCKEIHIDCFSDADWAGDIKTRKSVSGFITMIAGGPITYKSKQQSSVALSTAEAEYVAASLAARDIIWLRMFLEELGCSYQRVLMHIDSQATERYIRNPENQSKMKHIDIAYQHTRDSFRAQKFELEYINTKDQKADIFTKSLPTERFRDMTTKVGLYKWTCALVNCLIAILSCLITAANGSKLAHSDPVIWRPTIY